MTLPRLQQTFATADTPASARTILLVDDSRVQRRILCASLKRWGYEVLEASSGAEALALCAERPVDIILSDWMMPGMDGLEFCRIIRRMEFDRYVYFILLTSKNEKEEVAQGLDVGADDFLTKPVNADELRARIAAGERILQIERELIEKNVLLGRALAQLRTLYEAIDRDLLEARRLQQSLVPDRMRDYGAARLSMLLQPSGHLGGDLCGQFRVSEHRVGFYSIDVSGHGIASALMTARLAGYLTGASPENNIALVVGADGAYRMRPPAEVCAELNRILLGDMETEHYFTMVMGEIDLRSGRVDLVQAGHPRPLLCRAGGAIEFLGSGGLPIGLFDEADWTSFTVDLAAGDRLMLYTDGFTEAPAPDGTQLEEEGLAALLRRHATVAGDKVLETLLRDLAAHAGGADFTDDVSGVLLEYLG